ncbi:hypothetical protein Bcep18194_B2646 [Burkholderia lata]|uniref:Uncharacterized protein n=1 Tax=Burkholderia lata (strain ATCC 17760 / DSM 23089 / LMG 22485 / NCIMB 9086 / R18194 / 383) TaxID=482957 RepID=Q391V9_BURL3|nr:hypothetical protein Bcep18194_B2646 [Burkholderia lata]
MSSFSCFNYCLANPEDAARETVGSCRHSTQRQTGKARLRRAGGHALALPDDAPRTAVMRMACIAGGHARCAVAGAEAQRGRDGPGRHARVVVR